MKTFKTYQQFDGLSRVYYYLSYIDGYRYFLFSKSLEERNYYFAIHSKLNSKEYIKEDYLSFYFIKQQYN